MAQATCSRLLSERSGVRLSPGAQLASSSKTRPDLGGNPRASQGPDSPIGPDCSQPVSQSTLRAVVWRALRVKLLVFAVAAVVGSVWLSQHPTLPGSRQVVPEVVQRHLDDAGGSSRVQALLDEHDCWTSSAPAGAVPGHVVVTLTGDSEPTYGGARLTGLALAQLFEGGPVVGRVWGFCP